MNSPEAVGSMFNPRKIVGSEIRTIVMLIEAIRPPRVVLTRTVHLYSIYTKVISVIKVLVLKYLRSP